MRKAKSKRLWLIFIIFFCLFQSRTYASIPNPTDNYYLDEENLLDDSTKENINKTNRQLEDKTGSQVVVMTLANPEGLDGNYYGTEIFNAWKIGDQKKDNGVLILLLMSDEEGKNQINIITGYGIEGRLNDGKIGRIIDTFMLDKLIDGDYSAGINEGFNAVVGEIAAEYDIELEKDYTGYQEELANSPYDEGGISLGTIIFMIIIFIVISNIINKNNNYRGGGGGGFRRRRGYTYPRFDPGSSSWSSSSDSWGGSSFGGGSSGGGFGGGFSGGGGSSGGGGAGRKF